MFLPSNLPFSDSGFLLENRNARLVVIYLNIYLAKRRQFSLRLCDEVAVKRTGSNNNGQNVDLTTADNDIQLSQLAAADHGNTGTDPNDSGKISVLNRRALGGVASVLGLLFVSLLAGTLFFTSADDSGSSAPNFVAKTVSEKTIFTFSKSQPAEFSTTGSLNRSVLDLADISSSQKTGRSLAASRNQGVAETSAAQSSSANSARSQCSGVACLSPRRAPVATGVTVRLYKLGVEKRYSPSQLNCGLRKECTAEDGTLLEGAKFALYEGNRVDATKLKGEYTVGKNGVELTGLQQGSTYTLRELEAPEGYTKDKGAYNLVVSADGTVEWRRSKFYGQLVDNKLYFPNLKDPVPVVPEVSLFKLGVADLADCSWGSCSEADGSLVGGARFALYEGTEADTTRKVGDNFTVDALGSKIPGLQVGKTYTLQEVLAPEGYDINLATYTFEVDADGNAKYRTDTGSQSFTDNKIYFPNQKSAPPTVTVKLFKLGVTDSALVKRCTTTRSICSATDGELVGGAQFALYKGQGVDEANKVGEYTVGKGGVELPGLQEGTYTLKEIAAPAGYTATTTLVQLDVDDQGKVSFRRYRSKTITAPLVNNEFYFPNEKEQVQAIDISLYKVSDQDTALENVKFDLYEADNPDKPVQNITTGNDGKANLTVTPGHKYRLVETETVSGYALLPQAIEFQVAANGTVTIDQAIGNVNTVTGGDKNLKVVNYPEGKLPLSGQSGFLVVLLSGLSLLLVAVVISFLGRKRN